MITDCEFNAIQDRMVWLARVLQNTDIEGYLHRLKIEKKAAKILDGNLYDDGLRDFKALVEVGLTVKEFKDKMTALKKKWKNGGKTKREKALAALGGCE